MANTKNTTIESFVTRSDPAQHVTCDLSRSAHSSTPTSSAMSFARIVGLQPRLLVVATRLSSVNSLAARRLLSTSTCAHAEHNLQSNLEEKLRPVWPPTTTQQPQPLEGDPYRRGPSAIDKAVHLFFFTEILRGIPAGYSKLFLSLNGSRNVDRNGEFLPSTLYYHVSLREGSSIASLSWRARLAPLPKWRRTLHR